MNFDSCDSWVILSAIEHNIKEKIATTGVPLREWDITIYRGILTGFNDAFIISSETRAEILGKCVDEDERKRTDAIIRPILRGRDIQRYNYEWAELYIIATLPSRHYDIEDYPSIKNYLLSFGMERLEQTGETHIINKEKIKSRKKTNNKWFETQDSISYWDDFDKPKIIYPETTVGRSQFYYDDSKFMLDKTCFFISGEKLKFLEGMLTSKIIEWYLERMCRLLGKRTIQYSKQWIEDIPIASPNEKQEKDVVEIVDEITDNIKNDSAESQQKINLLIKKLNAKIGEIYNLNEQELDFIGVR